MKGKKLSILGDSISTYKGISNDEKANSTIYSNPYYYGGAFPVERTYWGIILRELEWTLCVNNSWSGGNLSGRDLEFSGVNRANNLSRDDGEMPDIIIVFMGMNDLGRRVDVSVFENDYKKTLEIIKNKHPYAKVCCVNLPDRDIAVKQMTVAFNEVISNAVKNAGEGFFIADLFSSRLNNDFYYMNTCDGLHPDEDGMRIIAGIVKEAILKEYEK